MLFVQILGVTLSKPIPKIGPFFHPERCGKGIPAQPMAMGAAVFPAAKLARRFESGEQRKRDGWSASACGRFFRAFGSKKTAENRVPRRVRCGWQGDRA